MELQSANQRLSALQESLSKSRTALENVESQEFSAKSEERQRHLRVEQERQNDRRKLFELESMLQAARQSVTRLEQELNASRRNEMNALEDARIARLRANSSPRVTFSSSRKDSPPTVTASVRHV